MACGGCAQRAAAAARAAIAGEAGEPAPGPSAGRVAVYQVVAGGEVVTSTKSPVAARAEAKRLNGHVKITSELISA